MGLVDCGAQHHEQQHAPAKHTQASGAHQARDDTAAHGAVPHNQCYGLILKVENVWFIFLTLDRPVLLDRRSGRFDYSLGLRSNPPIDIHRIDSNIESVVARQLATSRPLSNSDCGRIEVAWGVVDPASTACLASRRLLRTAVNV